MSLLLGKESSLKTRKVAIENFTEWVQGRRVYFMCPFGLNKLFDKHVSLHPVCPIRVFGGPLCLAKWKRGLVGSRILPCMEH